MRIRLLAGMISVGLLVCALPFRSDAAPRPLAASRFDTVKGWLGMRWRMSLPQVRAVLKRRGIRAKHEWQRGHFKGGCLRTDTLRFSWKGWKVTANIRQVWLDHVWMSRDGQTAQAVRALQKRLVRRYGPPTRSTPLGKIGKHGNLATWSGKHTRLSVAVVRQVKGYRIIQTYARR